MCACFLINRMASHILYGVIHFPCLYLDSVVFHVFHVSLCVLVLVHNLSHGLNKLTLRSIKCVSVEYSRTHKGSLF